MKSLNTSSDFKNSDKNLGFIPKINVTVRVDGVFNVPMEFKKAAADPKVQVGYRLCVLGMTFENGKVVPKKFTEEELRAIDEHRSTKGGRKAEPALPEDLEREIPGLDAATLSQHYDELENEYKFGAIRFLDVSGGPAKQEEEKRGEDLLVLETSVVRAESCVAYLIRTVQPSEEEAAKQRKKDAEGPLVQYFCARVSLTDLKVTDNMVLKGCFPFTEVVRPDRQPTEPRSPMYLKLEVRTDVPMGIEYKKKFNFDITDILKTEPKPLSAVAVAQKKFESISQPLFAEFERLFKDKLADPAFLEAYAGFNLQKMEKNSQMIRETAAKAKDFLSDGEVYSKFRDELRQLISSFIFQKYKVKNFRGVYMNSNDKIYGQVFNQFQDFGQQFAADKMAAFRHEASLSVPRADLLEADHLKALAQATGMPAEEHLKRLSQNYFTAGDATNAERAIKRAQKISPDDTEAQLIHFGQQIHRCDFSEAESTIFYAIGRAYNNWDGCFRLLLLFLERAKVKESVHIARYMIEKFPMDQLYFGLLWALLRKFADASSLIGYFQAKFYRAFSKQRGLAELKNADSPRDFLRGKTLEQVLELDPFWYEFKAAVAEAAERALADPDPKKQGDKKPEKVAPPPENRPKKVLVPKPSAAQMDEFILKQANNILELGFPRTCALLMDLIEGRESFEYRLLEFKIAKQEETEAESLQKLKALIASHGLQSPALLFEVYLRLDELVSEGVLAEESALEAVMEAFDQFTDTQRYSVLYRMAQKLFRKNAYDIALQIAVRGVELWPNSVPFWALVGECHFAKEQYEDALRHLSHANFLDNYNADVLILIILCLLRTHERCRLFATMKDLKNVGAEGCRLTGLLTAELRKNGFEEEAGHFARARVAPIEPN